MSRNDGFTLLEVLIALALLAILSAALYGTWFSLVRGREAATTAMEGRRELRDTVDDLHRELSAAFYSFGNDRLHFVVEDRDFFGKPASTLNFTTLSAPLASDQKLSDQTEVQYVPLEKDGKIVLTKQTRDVYSEAEPFPVPRMEQVEGFLVECSADGEKWVRSWDTTLNKSLPQMVRVSIQVKDGSQVVTFVTLATPRMR